MPVPIEKQVKTEAAIIRRRTFREGRRPHNVRDLHAQGLTPQQIADQVNLPVNHVRRVLGLAIPIVALKPNQEPPKWIKRNY